MNGQSVVATLSTRRKIAVLTFVIFVSVGLVLLSVLTQTSAIDQIQDQLGGSSGSSVVGPLSVTQTLLLLIPLGSLVLAIMFAGVAGTGLRPVKRMMVEADNIQIGDLDRRLADPTTGDEISDLAATLNKMLDRVSRGVEVERRFVTDAAHELRSPIAASTSLLEVLIKTNGNDWESTASAVLTEQRRLGNLVDDLVLLARLDEAGRTAQQGRSVSLDDIVVAETSNPFSVEIRVTAIEPSAIDGDEWAIVRMVRNLLSNANRHATGQIEVRLFNERARSVLIIDDDGPGIPTADRTRVFDRFARLDEARSRDAGGAGIGLAIVKQVVDFYAGTVVVSDSPLGGARFTVTLPRSEPDSRSDSIVTVDTGCPGDLRYALGSTLSGPPVHADNPTHTS